MAAHSRYSLTQDEAGMQDGVLKNKLGIIKQSELDDAETILFSDAYKHFFELLFQEKLVLDLSLLLQIHHYFLSPLYTWAGKIRTVDISKNGMMFASTSHIAASLKIFESILEQQIPKTEDTKHLVSNKLAVVHCELNAIHPFREGNGRTIRLFLDLLASRVGFNPIDWSKHAQKEYLNACIAGMVQEYSDMSKIIYSGLTKTK